MSAAESSTRVWVNGSVYSPADPFATAVLVSGATVAWVGSDDAARAMAGAGTTPGDLRAAVVTPAFVAHHRVPDAADDGAPLPGTSQGYGAVELLGADAQALAAAAERVAADGARPLPVLVRPVPENGEIPTEELPSPALGFDAAAHAGRAELRDAVREHLVACTRAGIQAVLVLADETGTSQARGGSASGPEAGHHRSGAAVDPSRTGAEDLSCTDPRGDETPSGGEDPALSVAAATSVVLDAAQAARRGITAVIRYTGAQVLEGFVGLLN